MSHSEDTQVKEFAMRILVKNKSSITAERIMAYDIPTFISKVSRDVSHQLANVSVEFIAKFPKTKTFLFKSFTKAAAVQLAGFTDANYNEQNVFFYPKFLENNLKSIEKKYFKMIFDFLIMECCRPENPMLMDLCFNIGVKILPEYSKDHATQIVDIFDRFLKKKTSSKKRGSSQEQELINSLVFISICAP